MIEFENILKTVKTLIGRVSLGGGQSDELVNGFSAGSFKTHKGEDAKRHSLLRLMGFNLKHSCWNSNSDLPKQLWCIPLNKFLILGRKFNLFFETYR